MVYIFKEIDYKDNGLIISDGIDFYILHNKVGNRYTFCEKISDPHSCTPIFNEPVVCFKIVRNKDSQVIYEIER